MKKIGSTDAVNVTVQFDSMRDDRTRRYYVREGAVRTTTSSKNSARRTPATPRSRQTFSAGRSNGIRRTGSSASSGTTAAGSTIRTSTGAPARAEWSARRWRDATVARCSTRRLRKRPTIARLRSTTRRGIFSTTSS